MPANCFEYANAVDGCRQGLWAGVNFLWRLQEMEMNEAETNKKKEVTK